MITDARMYRKACAVQAALERKVKAGTASDVERARCSHLRDHILVWEWAHDSTPPTVVIPREAPPTEAEHIARRFADWWEEHRFGARWGGDVAAAFAWWFAPRGRLVTEEEETVILDELEARGMIYALPDPATSAQQEAA